MHYFHGKIGEDNILELKQFLPRGTVIKNSQDVIAVVAFTGKETKITMNQGAYIFKQSDLLTKFNNLLLVQVAIFLGMIMLSAHWGNRSGLNYLKIHHYIFPEDDPELNVLTNNSMMSFFLLYNLIFPLELPCQISLVQAIYGLFLLEADA